MYIYIYIYIYVYICIRESSHDFGGAPEPFVQQQQQQGLFLVSCYKTQNQFVLWIKGSLGDGTYRVVLHVWTTYRVVSGLLIMLIFARRGTYRVVLRSVFIISNRNVSNPKSKYVAYVSVLSRISDCQGLGRKNKHEILTTDRTHIPSTCLFITDLFTITGLLSLVCLLRVYFIYGLFIMFVCLRQ